MKTNNNTNLNDVNMSDIVKHIMWQYICIYHPYIMVYHQILFKTFAKFCSHNNDKNVIDEKTLQVGNYRLLFNKCWKKNFTKRTSKWTKQISSSMISFGFKHDHDGTNNQEKLTLEKKKNTFGMNSTSTI